MTTVTTPSARTAAPPPARSRRRFRTVRGRPNWLGGLVSLFWLAVVVIPLYWIVITSFTDQNDYFTHNPLVPPSSPTLDNYRLVLENSFVQYFANTVVVTVGAVVPAVLVSFMAAFAVVRGGGGRFLTTVNSLFLMGLAIPLQAVVIPVYLIIIRLNLYNSLLALILPSIAFAIPLTVLVLSNSVRDVPKELFESMRLDGCSEWGTMWRLAFPLTRPALVTVTIYNGLIVWNNYLLPLILTDRPDRRTLPLGLAAFQGQYTVNIPAVLASVLLSTLPILILYVVGRRQLLSGLTAGFSK